MQVFDVRVLTVGENHIAVATLVRARLELTPAEIKAALQRGDLVVASGLGRGEAESLAGELKDLGANVRLEVSDPGLEHFE